MTRYDLISPRKRGEKTYWARIGAAFPRDKGGFSLVFDALPLPDEKGEVRLLMVEAKPRDGGGSRDSGSQGGGYGGGGPAGDLDDTIPFAPEWRG